MKALRFLPGLAVVLVLALFVWTGVAVASPPLTGQTAYRVAEDRVSSFALYFALGVGIDLPAARYKVDWRTKRCKKVSRYERVCPWRVWISRKRIVAAESSGVVKVTIKHTRTGMRYARADLYGYDPSVTRRGLPANPIPPCGIAS